MSSHGESNSTRMKEGIFGYNQGHYLKRYSPDLISRNEPYFHLELNAGPGFNPKSRTVGSPHIFMRQVQKRLDLNIDAVFVDKNRHHLEVLERELKNKYAELFNGHLFGLTRRFEFIASDNEDYIQGYVARVAERARPEYARGTIVCDPKGPGKTGGMVPPKLLCNVLQSLPRFMVLIYFDYASASRMQAVQKEFNTNGQRVNMTKITLDELLVSRPHWLISEPHRGRIYLSGTSVEFPPIVNGVRAYPWKCTEGSKIVNHVRSTIYGIS